MDTFSILVVEDNQGDLLLIREYLSERQTFAYHLEAAGNLESALELLARHFFDVVLLDLSLPDSFGLDTVRRVITNFPDIALIVLTGLQDEETALQSVRYGAQDYLEKQHLSPAMLYKSISYAMERKRSIQEKEDLLHDLTQALKKIESLEGILPICVSCKKILDENLRWQGMEDYMSHSGKAEVVQLVCPACRNELEKDATG
jgi:CheY-like chemotaxis protein